MIRFRRPEEAPEILLTTGVGRRDSLARKLEADPDAKLSFDSSVYGDRSVKDALLCAQHGKCAFCEQRVFERKYVDVEHFRPKGEVRQSRESAPLERGYWWLAYEWTNLVLACEQCNTDHKSTLFPLANPEQRARRPEDPLSAEQPLFIDPSQEDPLEYLRFRRHVAYSVDDNLRGLRTRDGLGLNRAPLLRHREEHLSRVKALAFVARRGKTQRLRERAKDVLVRLALPDAEFSAMVLIYLLDELPDAAARARSAR